MPDDDTRRHLSIEVDPAAEPITGTVRGQDGRAHAFEGWLELVSHLQTSRAKAAQSGSPAADPHRDGLSPASGKSNQPNRPQ
jgi:hypothetical protein